jgi:PAS domain S-box-containing protein
MTWIDLLWPMLGAASFTLALIHAAAWVQRPERPAQLMFAGVACSVGLLALVELRLMHAPTPGAYSHVLRWSQPVVAVLMLTLVAFVRLRFAAGKAWLAALVVGLRLAAVLANFTTGETLYFSHITALEPVLLWDGVVVSTPVGEPNPWMALGTIANLALVWFLLDTIFATARRGQPGEGRMALLVCGSMALFIAAMGTWAFLVATGAVYGPMSINVAFVGVVLIMSYVDGGDVTRANWLAEQLARSKGELQASERRMQQAADAADLGLWTLDLGSNEFWFTETSHTLLGWSPGDRISRDDILDRIHAEDRHMFARARDAAIRGGGDYNCEFRLHLPDGRVRWLSARGRVDYADDGAPYAIRGIVVDRTERRHADERFRLVVEAAPTAMLMIDSSGRVTLANIQAERVFGYLRNEMIGQAVEQLVPDRLPEGALESAGVAEDADARGLPLARRKDGSRFPIELGVTPLVVDGDACIIATVGDISERLRQDAEAALQRDELAHLSRVTLVGEMSGSLAHELNQPLAAILSNAQAALRFMDHSPAPLEDVRDCLVHIVENDKRAAEVIRRVRTMLRKEPAEHQRIDASDLVEDVVRLMRNDLLNREVVVSLDLAPDLPSIDGDRVQLQQVLVNLLMNACDAMDRGGGERRLLLATRAAEGGVEITLTDRGPGIPDEELDRIFSPFVTSKSEGIGLGLAICRSLVTAHRGRLWASNNPGPGATLHIALPAAP